MHKFLQRKWLPDDQTEDGSAAKEPQPRNATWPSKTQRYEPSFIKYGFTVASKSGRDVPKCVLCLEILSNKPSKLEQKHPTETNKIKGKEEHLTVQSASFKRQASVPEQALKESFFASYHIACAEKRHTIGEDLILPATKDIVQELLGEDAASKINSVPLSDNSVSQRLKTCLQ